MGVLSLLNKLLKEAGGEYESFLHSITRRKPDITIEKMKSRDLDSLKSMIRITITEKIMSVNPQDDIDQYSDFCNDINKSVKELKKYCLRMEKVEQSGLEKMIVKYNKRRKILEEQIDFLIKMPPVNDSYYNENTVKAEIGAINNAINAINTLRKNNKKLLKENKVAEYKGLDENLIGSIEVGTAFSNILKQQNKLRDENVEKAKSSIGKENVQTYKEEFFEELNKVLKYLNCECLNSINVENISKRLDEGLSSNEIYELLINIPMGQKLNEMTANSIAESDIIIDSASFKNEMIKELAKSSHSASGFTTQFFGTYFEDALEKIKKTKEEAANKEKASVNNDSKLKTRAKNKNKAIGKINRRLENEMEKCGKEIEKVKNCVDKFIKNFIDKWEGVKESFDDFENAKNGNFDKIKNSKGNKDLNDFIKKYDEQMDIIRNCCVKSNVHKKDGKIVNFDAKVKGKDGALKSVKINGFNSSVLKPFMGENMEIDKVLLKFNKGICKINEEFRKYENYLSNAKVSAEKIKQTIDKYVSKFSNVFEDKKCGSRYVKSGKININELRNLNQSSISSTLTLAQAIIIFYKYIDGYELGKFNIFSNDKTNNYMKSYLEEKDRLKLGYTPEEMKNLKQKIAELEALKRK